MRKRVSVYEEKKGKAKYEKYESDKAQQTKVRERMNVGASTEGKVDEAEDSTEARRKDDNGCTEVRNIEEVPALM